MHKYNLRGELVSSQDEGYYSPTTILDVVKSKKLYQWRERVGVEEADRVSAESTALGTSVHRSLEVLIAGGSPVITATAKPYVDGFTKWREKVEPKIIASEVFVISAKHKYAGTADLVCEIDGKTWIVDFKTSKSFHRTMGLQLVAYAQAWYEMTGIKPKTAILRLTDKTKKGWSWREYREPIGVFLAVKKYFDWEMNE